MIEINDEINDESKVKNEKIWRRWFERNKINRERKNKRLGWSSDGVGKNSTDAEGEGCHRWVGKDTTDAEGEGCDRWGGKGMSVMQRWKDVTDGEEKGSKGWRGKESVMQREGMAVMEKEKDVTDGRERTALTIGWTRVCRWCRYHLCQTGALLVPVKSGRDEKKGWKKGMKKKDEKRGGFYCWGQNNLFNIWKWPYKTTNISLFSSRKSKKLK